jgi:phosphopantothenoylcysteine decarboxylase/phosphopantothenate--cysteine ligase
LISGPSAEQSSAGIKRINVRSAAEMHQACMEHFKAASITVMSAAVADYTPESVAKEKIKKQDQTLTITLKKIPDILAELGSQKTADQILVGFALETTNEEEHAKQKLQRKNLDFIVLNSLNDSGAGFGVDTNKITIINKALEKKTYEVKSKAAVAADICQEIISLL